MAAGAAGAVADPVDRVGEPRSSQIRMYRLVRGALRHRAGPHPAATLNMRMESAEWGVPGRVPVCRSGFGPRDATDRRAGLVLAAYQSVEVVLDRARPRRRSMGRPAASNGPRSRGRKMGLTRLAEA